MPLDEDDTWPFTPIKKRSIPSRTLSARMAQMLQYIRDCDGGIAVTHLVLMPSAGIRTLNALLKRAYIRQDNNLNVVLLPEGMDYRRHVVGAELAIPDLDNL